MKHHPHQVPHYILIIEDEHSRKTLSLQDKVYSIGRSSRNSIMIKSEKVSRYHGTLIRRRNPINNDESYWMLDGDMNGNKSRNGIYINGKKYSVKQLKQGDLINFGGEVNATFYTINEWSDTIIPVADYQEEIITNISGQSIAFSQPNIEVSQSQPLDKKRILASKATINQKTTIQGESHEDPLTKLANKQLFRQTLSIAIKNANQKKSLLALMFLDINQFHVINKKWGYSIGDRILEEMAKRLNGSVRENDIVARWADDQFVILFPKILESHQMDKISARIIHSIQQPLLVSEYKFSLECSQGIAIYPQDGQEVETFLRTAEVNLLNHQKQNLSKKPLNQLVIKNKASKLIKVKKALEEALKYKDFLLYYQPQINIQTGKVLGMEALVRWNHPRLGLIPPHKFIPLAEQTELIYSLDKWVLNQACSQNIVWQNLGFSPLTISVNLSPYQFQKQSLEEVVKQVLQENKLSSNWLELEITEKAILVNPEISYQTILNLKKLGINLCLDDFCSGYSSLSHLINFPFDKIKIAQSSVKKMKKTQTNLAIISAALNLAKSLGMRIIAEGVETQYQLDTLKNLDCREMQGYLFSKPLTQEEATRFLYIHQRNPDYYASEGSDTKMLTG